MYMKLDIKKKRLIELSVNNKNLDEKMTHLIAGGGLSNGPTQECNTYYHCDKRTK